jgi:hypothetical protein
VAQQDPLPVDRLLHCSSQCVSETRGGWFGSGLLGDDGVCFVGRERGRGRGVGIAEEVGQRSTATRGSVELRSQSEQGCEN